jgi:Gas vesicle synthesis protein GvpL/GvpF
MTGRRYVYGVVPAGPLPIGKGDKGVEGADVNAVGWGPVTALVSPIGADRVRPSRANVTAHHRVVSIAHQAGPVLPVRFGTVIPDDEVVVSELLRPNAEHYRAMLGEVQGCDEYRLKVRYLPEVALADVVDRHPAVRKLRARLAASSGAASTAEKMRLGELVFAGLQRLRDEDASAVIGAVRDTVETWVQLEDRSEDVAVHLALLVRRGRRGRLDSAMEAFGDRQAARLKMEFTGPLAPWDFTGMAGGIG